MGFRFFKRIKLLPGVTLNLGKGVPSVSVGPRGAKATIGAKGISSSLGIPGTGASYQKKLVSWGSGGSKAVSSKGATKTELEPVFAPSFIMVLDLIFVIGL